MSTRSGIPDYRGPAAAGRPVTPITFQVFTRDEVARRRYWARSHRGWQVISRAEPNAPHRPVAHLQRLGLVEGLITPNADGLHPSGSPAVLRAAQGGMPGSLASRGARRGDARAAARLAGELPAVLPGLVAGLYEDRTAQTGTSRTRRPG